MDVPPDLSVNELARRAGVSPSQVSRIETGKLRKPSRAIIVALGRALNRNPLPLLVLAGHLSRAEAHLDLRDCFREGAEAPQEWGSWTRLPLADVRRALFVEDAPPDEVLRMIAADLFAIEETAETTWDDAHALLAATGPKAAECRRLAAVYGGLSSDDRRQVLAHATALRDRDDLAFQLEELRASSPADSASERRSR